MLEWRDDEPAVPTLRRPGYLWLMRRFSTRMQWLAAVGIPLIVPLLSGANAARRWGADGHRVIAEVALERLSPAVAAETRRLLGGESIADIASWADVIRRSRPATGPWHYVNIQIGDTGYVRDRDCKDACVVTAIDDQMAILANRSLPDSVRADALKFAVHFIGDLHQPLHAGDRHDQGGNAVRVTFAGRATNLHSLWDSGLLLGYKETNAELVRQIAVQIRRRTDIATISSGTPATWAVESHDVSRDVVYGNLGASLEITPQYAEAARPVIHEQLLRAGVRLAATLEQALGTR